VPAFPAIGDLHMQERISSVSSSPPEIIPTTFNKTDGAFKARAARKCGCQGNYRYIDIQVSAITLNVSLRLQNKCRKIFLSID
jgi:hypothetical protein